MIFQIFAYYHPTKLSKRGLVGLVSSHYTHIQKKTGVCDG
jgi:hypothetical protein